MKMQIGKHRWRRMARAVARYGRRVHGDDRGAISVLVLLTIWCLVAILAMLWNTTEQAVARERMQTAADSAAHMANVWTARATNLIAAQNMLIGEDASTEVIWRAIPPTDKAINSRLEQELLLAERMKRNPQLANLRARMNRAIARIAAEYELTNSALSSLAADTSGAGYADIREQITYQNRIRQAKSALDWVNNTYVNGKQPAAPVGNPPPGARPGPPGPNGEGLIDFVNKYQPTTAEPAILDMIIAFIHSTEQPIVQAFEARTQGWTSQPVDAQMAAHETSIYRAELEMVATIPGAVENSRQALADYYKTDITLATLNGGVQSGGTGGGSIVYAPLMPASAVSAIQQTDTIRAAYPNETAAAKLDPVVTIDPINSWGANGVWHPDIEAPVDAAWRLAYPNLAATYTVVCDLPGITLPDGTVMPVSWADMRAMPLERFVHQRVNGDAQDIRATTMEVLDQSRTVTLASQIRAMLGLPTDAALAAPKALPFTIPDDQPEPVLPPPPPAPGQPPAPVPPPGPPVYDNIQVLPRLTAPAGASAGNRATYQLYNQHGAAYTNEINNLRNDFISYLDYFDRFTEDFAARAWDGNVEAQCLYVLSVLGDKKQFMVLSTYKLYAVPDWAQAGLFDNIERYTEDAIIRMNITTIANQILTDLMRNDTRGIGGLFLDPSARQTSLRQAYSGEANAIADAILRPTARRAAIAIATECLNRPWPYEITPPALQAPPARGMGIADRQRDFTVLAAARQTDASAPRVLLPTVFGAANTQVAAYAQGENFNWNEFNSGYGAAERFDEISLISEFTYYPWYLQNFVPVPRQWRVSSVGGWEWRARLSLSDALYSGAMMNAEFRNVLQSSGINLNDKGSTDALNLH